jgi:outer membrane protein OmpA-like peptidoglycan-associated protein
MKKLFVVVLCSLLALASVSCSTWTREQKGAAIGAAAGGAVGSLIGHKAGNTAVGTILGAMVGGAAGAYIGNYMDKQAAEMEKDLAGAKIQRVGEGIKVTFDSGLLFDIDKATLRSASQEQLSKLAVILNKYPDTNILLEGHTDSTGTAEHNLQLSHLRAESVAAYLSSLGVNPARFTITGYGQTQPIAGNTTAEGRQLNRRVEVAIYANDKLKEVAKTKAEG